MVHSFLSLYLMHPAPGHMKAALYVLHYINSTHNFGISLPSRFQEPIHMFLHQLDAFDVKAFTNTVLSKKDREHYLTTYSDACWVS